jgi:hypothetical protein
VSTSTGFSLRALSTTDIRGGRVHGIAKRISRAGLPHPRGLLIARILGRSFILVPGFPIVCVIGRSFILITVTERQEPARIPEVLSDQSASEVSSYSVLS